MMIEMEKKEAEVQRDGKVNQWLNRGVGFFDKKQFDLAYIEFRKVLEFDPSNRVAKRYVDRMGDLEQPIDLQREHSIAEKKKCINGCAMTA